MTERRGTLAVFLGGIFAITWALWLPLCAASAGFAVPTFPLQFFVASFGPICGAALASLYAGGLPGVRAWALRCFSLRASVPWLMAVLAMLLIYFLAGYGLAWISAGVPPDLAALGTTVKLPGFGIVAVAVVWITTFGIREEAGWRGWLLPHLAARMTTLNAALVVSVVWLLWHLPAFFFNPTYERMGWGIVGWMISLISGSVLLAWITERAHWSIVPVVLWHAGFDLLTAADQSAGAIASAISAIVIMQGVVAAWLMWHRNRTQQVAVDRLLAD